MQRGYGEPQRINLVNAGCRQAGPKIRFDLSSRRSDCGNNLRDELGVSRAQTASSRSNLECPPGVNLKAGNIPETYNDITKSIILKGAIALADYAGCNRRREPGLRSASSAPGWVGFDVTISPSRSNRTCNFHCIRLMVVSGFVRPLLGYLVPVPNIPLGFDYLNFSQG